MTMLEGGGDLVTMTTGCSLCLVFSVCGCLQEFGQDFQHCPPPREDRRCILHGRSGVCVCVCVVYVCVVCACGVCG